MRNSLLTFTVCFIALSCGSQDKRYDHSFIRFHLYGQGEPVFVLSGGPGTDYHQEEDVAIRIGEQYQAIILEQRGTGNSMPSVLDETTITLDAYLQDILFVMDSLQINTAIFYGHSWGGMYATAFATQHPEKVSSLILTGPGFIKLDTSHANKISNNRMVKLSPGQRQQFEQLRKMNDADMSVAERHDIAMLRTIFNIYDTTNLAYKFEKIQIASTNKRTNALMLQDLQRIQFDLSPLLPSLPMPITIITCKEDPLAPFTVEYHHYAPQSNIVWLDHCGHFPMYEQPGQFYPVLMEALDK